MVPPIIYYCVWQIGTGNYFVTYLNGNSSTRLEPSNPLNTQRMKLRIFKTKQSARNAISAWRRGHFYNDGDDGMQIQDGRKYDHRKLMPLEIVEVKLFIQ